MGLFVLQWNDHSLIIHGQEMYQFIDSCHIKLSVICIQKTGLNCNVDFKISEYTVIRHDRPGNVRYGGYVFCASYCIAS